MSELRTDLIAAKARVNTLHKWKQNGGMLAALRSVIGDDEERVERANQALGLATPPLNIASRRNAIDSRRRITSPEIEHADVMAIFDRAASLVSEPSQS